VATHAGLQPLDAQGDIVYTNLWVAGGGLAGADPIQERSLEGIAIATGIAAVESMLSSTIK
jgi:glycerol-3-phosphate dehydrogenase subunit B